jgi:type II secretory pathway predicted ATPase ExeA
MLRDVFDRGQMGLVLVGRPGLEKKVRSIAPLASRVGMRLEFAGLSVQELDVLLKRYIQGAGVEIDALGGECPFSAESRQFSGAASGLASN